MSVLRGYPGRTPTQTAGSAADAELLGLLRHFDRHLDELAEGVDRDDRDPCVAERNDVRPEVRAVDLVVAKHGAWTQRGVDTRRTGGGQTDRIELDVIGDPKHDVVCTSGGVVHGDERILRSLGVEHQWRFFGIRGYCDTCADHDANSRCCQCRTEEVYQ